MLTGSENVFIGGIAGTVLGFSGGAFGTYCSIRNARAPLERAFMIKASIVTWITLLVFLGLLLGLPSPYRFLMWIPYGIGLPLGIRYMNRRIQQIRTLEPR